MAANIGRSFTVQKGAAAIAGVTAKTVTINGEPVDITGDDDNGFRTLLDVAGTAALDISVEGVTKDADLRAAMMVGTALELTDISLLYPNGDTVTGTFFFNSLEENGAHNDAVRFSGSLQSSGAWVYTAAP